MKPTDDDTTVTVTNLRTGRQFTYAFNPRVRCSCCGLPVETPPEAYSEIGLCPSCRRGVKPPGGGGYRCHCDDAA